MRLFVCIVALAGAVTGVKKADKSSLFQAYAMNPYGYPGYYMPYQPMAYYAMPPNGPPAYYPQIAAPQGPQVPNMAPPLMPVGPYAYQPPRQPPQYYYQPQAYSTQITAKVRDDPMPVGPDGTGPFPGLETPFRQSQHSASRGDSMPQAPKPSETRQPGSSNGPIKEAFSVAMEEAAKQIDQVNAKAAEITAFNQAEVAAPFSLPKEVSLSQESVPIDSHILNWRDLVGLPSRNPVINGEAPLKSEVTPLLSGKWN